jgi:catechol 2,3-dioxygenase-like lactoylglutathione lyase family enzyme
MEESRTFYGDFLGLSHAMDLGWVSTFVSTSNPTAQITLMQETSATPDAILPHPHVSIEVDDVDGFHASAVSRGYEIIYPLTLEPWGVKRFFVRDPNGHIINILSHAETA